MNNFTKNINESLAIISLFYASVGIGSVFSSLKTTLIKQLFIFIILKFALIKNVSLSQLIMIFLLLFNNLIFFKKKWL